MALRFFYVLLVLSFFATGTSAREVSLQEKEDFRNAKIAFKKGLYDTSLTYLKDRYSFRSLNTPTGALELGALANEKLGYNKEALFIYSLLIKKKYERTNRDVIRAYRSDGNADNIPDDIDEKLSFYYYRKAHNAKVLFDESNNDFYFKAATMYAAVCMEGDHYEDEAEELFEAASERSNEYKRLTFKKSYNALISYMTWQNELTLTSNSGTSQEIKSTTEGTCLGGGIEYANAYVVYRIDGCLAFASATVGEDSADIDYFQSKVSERALFVFPGVRWKPAAGSVSIGLSTPLVYRVGDFTEPDGFTVDGKTKIGVGLMIETGWQRQNFGVDLKLGKISGFSSTTMSFGANYKF